MSTRSQYVSEVPYPETCEVHYPFIASCVAGLRVNRWHTMASLPPVQPILLGVFTSAIPPSTTDAEYLIWSFAREAYTDLRIERCDAEVADHHRPCLAATIRLNGKDQAVTVICDDEGSRTSCGLIVNSLQSPKNLSHNQLQGLGVLLRTALRGITAVRTEQERSNNSCVATQDIDGTVEAVVRAYEHHLKFTPADDRWHDPAPTTGRNRFAAQVRLFVSQGMPIQAVLPAFSCKSSNLVSRLGQTDQMLAHGPG